MNKIAQKRKNTLHIHIAGAVGNATVQEKGAKHDTTAQQAAHKCMHAYSGARNLMCSTQSIAI